MSFSNLLHYSYYFDNVSGQTFTGFTFVLILLILIVIVSSIVSYKAGKWSYFKKVVAVRLTRTGFAVGWFGLAWVWLRFEGIPYLSWRFWPTILIIYFIYEMVMLAKFIWRDYPKNKAKKMGKGDKDLYLRRYLGK